MARHKITGLKTFTIRNVEHTDRNMIRLKLHSKQQRLTRFIEIDADSIFDGDGNLFENNAPYVPRNQEGR
jgi:hypothetical protein